jgi:hypothetical protein
MAKDKSFLEFARGFNNPLEANFDSRDPAQWKHVSEGTYVFRQGKPAEATYDFSDAFPIDNGGEPPYRRERARVDRLEGYLFALYKHRGGTGDFEPFPLPTPEQLQENEG